MFNVKLIALLNGSKKREGKKKTACSDNKSEFIRLYISGEN